MPHPLHDRLSRLVRFLREAGYEFEAPDEVLPGPLPDTAALIGKLQALVGPIPPSLKVFYETVGSVNLLGAHPRWADCPLPDPLVVYPLTAAVEEALEYAELGDPAAEYWASESGVFRIPIAPDPLHKAHLSGGMWLGVEVGTGEDDPPVLEDPNDLPFTQYIAFALSWGGFPGLRLTSGHQYPLTELRAAAAAG